VDSDIHRNEKIPHSAKNSGYDYQKVSNQLLAETQNKKEGSMKQ